jgi:hypothetical protein
MDVQLQAVNAARSECIVSSSRRPQFSFGPPTFVETQTFDTSCVRKRYEQIWASYNK